MNEGKPNEIASQPCERHKKQRIPISTAAILIIVLETKSAKTRGQDIVGDKGQSRSNKEANVKLEKVKKLELKAV